MPSPLWFVTLFCSGSGPNCSTAVMFLEMDVSWCVSSGNAPLRGNLVSFWLVDHKIWPRHSSWYMLCTICIHNSQVGTLVIKSYDVQTSKSVIFDMIQICFKQFDTLKLLILSNKQHLSSSWIFIFHLPDLHLNCPEWAPCRIPGLQAIRRNTAKEDAISLWQP